MAREKVVFESDRYIIVKMNKKLFTSTLNIEIEGDL